MKARTILICIGIALLMSGLTLHAEQNPCMECIAEKTDTINIRKIGYGYSKDRLKAEALAQIAARDSLLEVLRDSVAMICYSVEVKRDAEGDYLRIKYFNKKEKPTKYYFMNDGILTNITVLCQESVCDEKKKYKACCVLGAPEKDFSRASNTVMFEILCMMSSFF